MRPLKYGKIPKNNNIILTLSAKNFLFLYFENEDVAYVWFMKTKQTENDSYPFSKLHD